jgi:hypothetical protein
MVWNCDGKKGQAPASVASRIRLSILLQTPCAQHLLRRGLRLEEEQVQAQAQEKGERRPKAGGRFPPAPQTQQMELLQRWKAGRQQRRRWQQEARKAGRIHRPAAGSLLRPDPSLPARFCPIV